MTTKIKTANSPKPSICDLALIGTLAAEGQDAQAIATSLSDLAAADARVNGLPAPARWTREAVQRIMVTGERQRHARLNAEHLERLHAVGIIPLRSADGKIRYGCDEEPRPLKKRELVGRSEHNATRKTIT